MAYRRLYEACQNETPAISRKFVKEQTLHITGANSVRIVKTALDTTRCRGFFLSAVVTASVLGFELRI